MKQPLWLFVAASVPRALFPMGYRYTSLCYFVLYVPYPSHVSAVAEISGAPYLVKGGQEVRTYALAIYKMTLTG